MIKPPNFLGRVVYFFGYPIFKLLIKGSTRAYVIVLVGDEILLTKNWLGFQKKWRLPGGGVQHGEEPVIAAQRELKEEIGVSTHEQNLEPVGTEPFNSSFRYKYYLFVLRMPNQPKLSIDNKEILTAKFAPISKLSQMHISEEVSNFLRLAK